MCQDPATAGDVHAAMPRPAAGSAADPIALEPVDHVVVTGAFADRDGEAPW